MNTTTEVSNVNTQTETALDKVAREAAILDAHLSDLYWFADRRTKRTHRLMDLTDQLRAIRRELEEMRLEDADAD